MTDLHIRHQLRQAAALALKAAGIVAAASVLPHRRRATTPGQLPALLIFTEDDSVRRETAETYGNAVDLVIRIRAATVGDDVAQDVLDALALKVERALAAAGDLGGLAKDLELVRRESSQNVATDRQLGDLDLTYRAEIFSAANDPATPH